MSRLTSFRIAAALGAVALAAGSARAQDAAGNAIAARVAAAPDGEVRMTYATRSGVCGDGGDVVAFANALTVYPSMESYGSWSGVRCVPGPARVVLTVRAHRVASLRTHVGAGAGGGIDLGTVSAPAAAAYFLGLARTLDGEQSRNALLPAVIADSAPLAQPLLALAGDPAAPRATRRRAAHWAGVLGDASAVPALERLAADSDASLGESALAGLAAVPDAAGVPSLARMARGGSERQREKAVFWLGQTDRDDALTIVRSIAEDGSAPEHVRGMAIFALGQRDDGREMPYLRALFPKLGSDALREKVLMAAAQRHDEGGGAWLLSVARDAREPEHVRLQAVFWAGQGGATTRDIAALYDTFGSGDAAVKEHTIFTLSQRDDDAATTKLIDIARRDGDRRMREKALFWLAQKHDPRVDQLLTDLVTRE